MLQEDIIEKENQNYDAMVPTAASFNGCFAFIF